MYKLVLQYVRIQALRDVFIQRQTLAPTVMCLSYRDVSIVP